MAPTSAAVAPIRSGGRFLDGISHTLDQLDTCFDDTHAVGNAGLLLAATLAEVIQQAHRGIDRVRRTPHLAYSLLRHTGLSVT